MNVADKRIARERRRDRVRQRVRGTDQKPRLSIYRSNRHMYVQLISDESGRTLLAASTLGTEGEKTGNKKAARELGQRVAQLCQERDIQAVVFDRNGFLYPGRVKEVADGARAGGLKF